MASMTEPEVLDGEEVAPSLQAVGGSFDVQVATAKRYPRSVETFLRRAMEMATLTPEVAASCVYALPRDGKMIEGPSARLAELVANAWGNLRIKAGADADLDGDSRFIVGYGEAWDVEANVAIRFEVRRRITNRSGQRYNDDMVVVTGNAAASIALRNAVFKAVPSPFWRPVYQKCRAVIAGSAQTFAVRRDEMLKLFGVMGVTKERLYGALGVKGIADVTMDHMVQLTGFYNALKEGEITIEDAFPEGGGLGAIKAAPRTSEQNGHANGSANGHASGQTNGSAPAANGGATTGGGADKASEQGEARTRETASASSGTVAGPSASPHADPPKHIGVIVQVTEVPGGALIVLDTQFACVTANAEMIQAAVSLRDARRRVELATRANARGADKARVLEEIISGVAS